MTQDSLASLSTPSKLRAELEAMVRRDLLGPAGGLEEEVDERAVRGRYILGRLARLLEMNHQRYAEEVAAGLHKRGKGKAKAEVEVRASKPRRRKIAKDDRGALKLS